MKRKKRLFSYSYRQIKICHGRKAWQQTGMAAGEGSYMLTTTPSPHLQAQKKKLNTCAGGGCETSRAHHPHLTYFYQQSHPFKPPPKAWSTQYQMIRYLSLLGTFLFKYYIRNINISRWFKLWNYWFWNYVSWALVDRTKERHWTQPYFILLKLLVSCFICGTLFI